MCIQAAVEPIETKKLTLAELLATASTVQTNLLTFHFAGIAGHETGFAQLRLERCVIVDQSAGNAVAHRTGLARLTATGPAIKRRSNKRSRIGSRISRNSKRKQPPALAFGRL